MLIKFLAHGSGDAARAASYVLDELDHLNVMRAGVKVLRGNLQQFAYISNSLPFRQRYTSGVIAWSLEDQPSSEEIEQVINDFESVAFAGFESDEYHFNVIQHIEPNGSVHLHILIPRVNLRSGKSLNIAPPGWESTFYPLRNAWNNEKGWARPDDPLRSRTHQPGHHRYVDAAAVRSALEVEPDSRQIFASFIENRIKEGLIKNRHDVLNTLYQFGDVTRKNANFISIKPFNFDQAVRLKGAFFEESFDSAEWLADQEQLQENKLRYSSRERITPEHEKRATLARIELARVVEKRTKYNHHRYHRTKIKLRSDQAVQGETAQYIEALTLSISDLHQQQIQTPGTEYSDGIRTTTDSANNTDEQTVRTAGERLSNTIQAVGVAINRNERIAELNERELRATAERERKIAETAFAIEQQSRRVATGIEQLAQRQRDELVCFKQDIDLVKFSGAYGYEYQRRGSTANSAILKKGKETLIVITDAQTGYAQYFSLDNHRDCGSIIDFLQNRESLNLGKVRKKLRPWLASSFVDVAPSLVPIQQTKLKSASRSQVSQILEWHRLPDYRGNFLQEHFYLNRATIELFAGSIKQNIDNFPCFRHVNQDGISGYEIENGVDGYFSARGTPALFMHRVGAVTERIVIVNSATQAMAYHQLKGQKNTMYIALSNTYTLSELQLELLSKSLNKENRLLIPVVIALPRNDFSSELVDQVKNIIPRAMNEYPKHRNWSEDLRYAPANQHKIGELIQKPKINKNHDFDISGYE